MLKETTGGSYRSSACFCSAFFADKFIAVGELN